MKDTEKSTTSSSQYEEYYPAGSDPLTPLDKPELVFGIVAPVGVDRQVVCDALTKELHEYGYKNVERIHVSALISLVPKYKSRVNSHTDEFQRICNLMTDGTEIREQSELGDALAILAMSEIAQIREQLNKQDGLIAEGTLGRQRTAYIIDSLKHPDEVKTLRATYGRGFILISVFSDRERRIDSLASRIAYSQKSSLDYNHCRARAEELIDRDEREEGNSFGQNVLNTFPLADLFIDIGSKVRPYQTEIARFCEIVFNNPFITPSIDEWGMFHAEAASWRSADLSRQVGASICKSDGTLIAVGCNEVPAAGGGLYWEDNKDDNRDFKRQIDEGTRQKNLLLAEVIKRLATLLPQQEQENFYELSNRAAKGEIDPSLNGLLALNVIEYGRAVHAEMAAISDAARNGTPVQGHFMYVNTLPCHICARHIIASGITRVVYIQPYPKSFTRRLFDDSVTFDANSACSGRVAFVPFSGVAPRFYQFAFQMQGKRKNADGRTIQWTKANASTKLKRYVFSYVLIENQVINALLPKIYKLE